MSNNIITIVGAGISGITAAINLAKAGYNPVVYENHIDVGHRFNGDFQGLENWSDEEDTLQLITRIGIKVNFLCHPYYGEDGIIYGPNLVKNKVKTSRPLFYLIERGSDKLSLDQSLKNQAEKCGVKFVLGKQTDNVKDDYIISGTGPKAADIIAKGIVFKTTLKNNFIVFVDNKVAPKGYAYLLVNNGKATFATCMFEDFRNERKYFDRSLSLLNSVLNIDIIEPKEFGGFGNFFNDPVISKNKRILYVGENAGFQDALWGFGIKYAMLSGYYAAQSIIHKNDYNDLCKKHLLPKFQTSIANRWLFAHLYNTGYNLLINKLRTMEDVIPALTRHHNTSYSKQLVYKIAKRWYKTRFKDKQCMHKNCDCVWCRHGKGAHSPNKKELT